ncbi:MAG TPA: NUDIX domain-containing protein [Patescibacteria group bacterium]|nr:NUDIX domain-containing protein [Patescibacteria group bacterium]
MTQRVRAIIKQGGKLLLIRRRKPGLPDYWVFPGGGVEAADSGLKAALARECREELGVQISVGDRFYSMEEANARQSFFFAVITGGVLGTGAGPEFKEGSGYTGEYLIEWVNLSQLSRLNVLPKEVADRL